MKRSLYIGFLGLLFLILSCESPTEEDSSDNGSTIDNYIYPISLNNNWIYDGNYVVSSVDDSSIISDINQMNIIIVDSIYNIENNIYRFKTYLIDEDIEEEQIYSGYQYFSNNIDGLYYHGGEFGGSLVIPWLRKSQSESQIFYKINNKIYSINELIDLLNYGTHSRGNECWEYPPKLSISYPVSLDNQWTYREFVGDCDNDPENDSPFRMDKLVIEKSEDTFRIQTLYDLDENSEWDEDIRVFHTYSINGLTNYRVEIDNQIITDQFGNELGSSNSVLNQDLIGSEIH